MTRGSLEDQPRADSDRARLIGQETDPRARTALLIEREVRRLIRHVVDEQRRIPVVLQDSEAEIDQVVRRQLRIEREDVLRERTADVTAECADVDRAEA